MFAKKIESADHAHAALIADDDELTATFHEGKAAAADLGFEPAPADFPVNPADIAPDDASLGYSLGGNDRGVQSSGALVRATSMPRTMPGHG
ncbi:hypothetical protein [Defluviimonas salinarum]|uniref:Uncharacterized protein n=1 Tax=Defluviimonas salinarum TaxID=2992147 RepID=A0ABT3IX87_9RHOB|nr:hypothetical protein [Defluviimonas salinarum]MCW3779991.1 hypothetical protein [Defluviimonas salinarum]